MRITVFLNGLGLGGTEKAACRWAHGLMERGHEVSVLALLDGPRRMQLEEDRIPTTIVVPNGEAIADLLRRERPDVIHAHVPGNRHIGETLGDALARLPKIPVVQTNIFGRLENPLEDRWTDFRLYISWTSCVQAARRAGIPLTPDFFRRASVAVYPLDPRDGPAPSAVEEFRRAIGVSGAEVLFGRLSRPEPNKWIDLPVDAFRFARRSNQGMKLLLREPPVAVARELLSAPDKDAFVILPATSDQCQLELTISSLDAVLHTSSIGESFGYGIAEPMNFGKPIIVNSTPWGDQAQIELVQPGMCGLLASTSRSVAKAMTLLASDPRLRAKLGEQGRKHIRRLADPINSLDRLEDALLNAVRGLDNANALADSERANQAARLLDRYQFSGSIEDAVVLRGRNLRHCFHQIKQRIARGASRAGGRTNRIRSSKV